MISSRTLLAWLAACVLVLGVGCGSRPPSAKATGDRVVCTGGGFSLVVPEGWDGRVSRAALTVTRSVPYGGGYPALNVRRVDASEAAAVDFDGATLTRGSTEVEYRYRRWRNARGQGYRLEALLRSPRGVVFADGAIWDPAQTMDQRFFHEAFWPMLNSLEVGPAASE